MPAGLPALLQSFFTDRLCRQRRASPNTIAGYRDSFRLLFHFAKERLGKAPSKLMIEDLNVSFIGDFLDHLEKHRKNSARTRNIRLAAIHSFFQYVAFEEPAHALLCQRVLAMPTKRHERRPIEFLNREEFDALLASVDLSTRIGRRDRTLLLLAVQTGLRVWRLLCLRRAPVNPPSNGIAYVPATPTRLRLLTPAGLTFRFGAGPLSDSYSRIRPEPPATDYAWSLAGLRHRDDSSLSSRRGSAGWVNSDCLGHFWKVRVVCGVQEYAESRRLGFSSSEQAQYLGEGS